jgi:hypothetical protein
MQFGVDECFVSRDLHHVIPAIVDTIKTDIQWSNPIQRVSLYNNFVWFPDAIGAVDGTIHRRWRPSARQRAFYRGDKGTIILFPIRLINKISRLSFHIITNNL